MSTSIHQKPSPPLINTAGHATKTSQIRAHELQDAMANALYNANFDNALQKELLEANCEAMKKEIAKNKEGKLNPRHEYIW